MKLSLKLYNKIILIWCGMIGILFLSVISFMMLSFLKLIIVLFLYGEISDNIIFIQAIVVVLSFIIGTIAALCLYDLYLRKNPISLKIESNEVIIKTILKKYHTDISECECHREEMIGGLIRYCNIEMGINDKLLKFRFQPDIFANFDEIYKAISYEYN